MPLPQVVAVAASSPAERAGVLPGDEIRAMNGQVPRDVIAFRLLADEAVLELDLARGGLELSVVVEKRPGEPLGCDVSSALFDRVRTCDNHCEFCFIDQLPKQLRKSLYVRDDDYRLSFLYGNFTTLTRFTESDLERVVTEGLSPLFVSIHATDPEVRARMLRNRRGATSLRWLGQLLAHGIEVHGQIVVCPGVNDGDVLEDTLAGVGERFPGLASVAAVPLGVSRHGPSDGAMRPHLPGEAAAVLDLVEFWQELFSSTLGRRLVFAADEYYLLAGRPFPGAEEYEVFAQHENGIGMARSLEEAFFGRGPARPVHTGFFAALEGVPATGYRAARAPLGGAGAPSGDVTTILTGEYGARVLAPLLARAGREDVRVLPIRNDFFGGNIAVTGLLTGADIARALAGEPPGRYLLPDVCLSEERFLDGLSLDDLPHAVEVVATDGASLARALSRSPRPRRLALAVSPAKR